jgi:hypothetical protein
MGNQASITHHGVVEVEEALEDPSRPTEHFPAFNLVMVQRSVVGCSQNLTGEAAIES